MADDRVSWCILSRPLASEGDKWQWRGKSGTEEDFLHPSCWRTEGWGQIRHPTPEARTL